jgi:hypothetical protein
MNHLTSVAYNRGSTARQYALRERAVALGWSPDRIMILGTISKNTSYILFLIK